MKETGNVKCKMQDVKCILPSFCILHFTFCILFLSFIPFISFAQYSPKEIKYSVIDFYALRYYPFKIKADSIIRKVIDKSELHRFQPVSAVYKKTAVNLVSNTEYMDSQFRSFTRMNNVIYKYVIKPYEPWLQYAKPLKENGRETALTVGLYEEYLQNGTLLKSRNEGIYDCIGIQDIGSVLDKTLGDIDLLQNKSEVMLFPFKSPLVSKNSAEYNYFLSAIKQLDNRQVYEIAFYPENSKDNKAFTGYLYVTADGNYSPVKALFTLNAPYRINFIKDILFVQIFENRDERSVPLKKETVFTWGDEIAGSLLVNRAVHYAAPVDSLPVFEKQIGKVVKTASQTGAFQNLQTGVHFLLTDHLTIGGKNGFFEYGPVLQSVSYNEMEGLRLKASGNTTLRLNRKLLLGGSIAYGTNDRRFKYRGDVIYSFLPKNKDIWEFPKRLLQFSYTQDLNNPGEDLFTSNRDHLLYSFSQARTNILSFQKVAILEYEHELQNHLSFKIGGKYLYDRTERRLGNLKALTSSEMNFSLRYAPRELFIQNRSRRIYLRKFIELNISHRIGLKDVFGSDYPYQITNLDVYRKLYFPQNTGTATIRFSAGKVWSRVPFPLLFITKGNQSYIFREDDYNLMNYYEFITDNFVAGNVNFQFNWSPFRLFYESKVKTGFGSRIIYGPLSDNNNPAFHFELYPFSPEVRMLGKKPYVEMNIGFSDILKILRVEWVHRLTYREPDTSGKKKRLGSLFVTVNLEF
jgi:hypothetical protein